MAVTTNRKEQEQLQQQAQQQQQNAQQQQAAVVQQQQQNAQQNPYNGLAGVSANTAQQAGNYQNGYQKGDAVTAAQQQLQQMQNIKPQGYTSKYSGALDNILQQIQNPQQFKYSFNGDELFKMYADKYTQLGKQASLDTMGQAAALTGGYGNSYAQNAANQQYQQYLLNLYDKGMDLYDRAYQRYQDQQGDLYNQYNLIAGADDRDYGRYRDELGDWQNERDYYTNRYDTEAEREYNRYANERDYWTGLAQVENADYRNDQDRQEAIRQYEQNFAENQRQFNENLAETKRQFDENLNWDKMSTQQKYAYEYAMNILNQGKMPSLELLMQAGLSEADAKKLMAQIQQTSRGSGYVPKTTNGNDMSMQKAEQLILQSLPGDAQVGNTGKTVNEMKKDIVIDTARPYNNQAAIDIRNGTVSTKNSAAEYAASKDTRPDWQKAADSATTMEKLLKKISGN